jgi:hypothetical protein
MSHIFISYSHHDRDYATRLAAALEQEGFSVWIDDRIDYGTHWPLVIQEHLDGCHAFVVVMTPRSLQSEWVQNELSRAKSKGKSIFPLLLEGDDTWLSVQATQHVDVRNGQMPPPRFYEGLARVAPRESSSVVVEKKLTEKEQPKRAVQNSERPQASKFNYRSLRIAIRATENADEYKIEIKESPIQMATASFLSSLKSLAKPLDKIVAAAHQGPRASPPFSMPFNQQKEFGRKLFDLIFSNAGHNILYESYNALGSEEGLRIQIGIDDDEFLRRIPWEFVHGGDELGFLSISAPRLLFSRHVSRTMKGGKLSAIALPLQMLVVFSEPPGVDVGCKLEEETLRQTLESFVKRKLVEFEVKWNITPHEFQQLILDNRYHIIHFAGIDSAAAGFDEGIVLVEDSQRAYVTVEELRTMFRGQNKARLIVLNTCYATNVLSPALIRAGVPAVVAMQFWVAPAAGAAFPKFFYPALFSSPTQFQVEAAITQARTDYFIDLKNFGRNRIDWINPALTTSVSDGNFLERGSS